MALLAHILTPEKSEERRRNARRLVALDGTARRSLDRDSAVRIYNLSRTGLLIESEAAFEIGEIFWLELPEIGPTPARARRSQGRMFGCEFLSPVTQGALSAALLKSSFGIDQRQQAERDTASLSEDFRAAGPQGSSLAATYAITILFSLFLAAFAFMLAFLPFS
ncbi:PilZ domain-containing protein [Sphingopyxis indica]|uniref:PilZ domain-containing protein n=1 Tax=Sphingopyxis indica TaxID=436663 RepID=UPI0029392152|nr:PilZ domain-containing protein [Sphingopyxis indica]WOF43811.1 PilZ domain-containing protein [Sphingopyxis indica]